MNTSAAPTYVSGTNAASSSAALSGIPSLGCELVAQRGAALAGPCAGLAHERVRIFAAQALGQREDEPLGHDQPARGLEVGEHPLGVHDKAVEHLRHVTGASARGCERPCDSVPFGLPGAGRALVLLHEATRQERRRGLRLACTGQRERRSDRVALVRERGGSAAALAGGLAQLADLGLGHEHDVERDLAERARQRCQGRPQGGDAHARGVPGQHGLLQGELARHAAHDFGAVLAQDGQRAGRAAQLHRQAVARVDRQSPGLEHADEPRRGLAPEHRRQRLLEQRARDHGRRTVAVGQRGAGRRHPCDVLQHELERTPADEHRGGVHDVLAGRAVVDVARRLAADGRAQRAHERLGRIARAPSLLRDQVAVEAVGATGGGDRLGSSGRDHADCGLGAGQRALAVQHRLQPGAIIELVEQHPGREDRVEHG